MNKFAAILGAVALSLSAGTAFAQSGEVSIPGIGNAKGSMGSKLTNSTINVMRNTSDKVTVGGGSAELKVASVKMSGVANVNSVNVTGSTLTNSHVNVMDNKSKEVTAIGGLANVNSVNIN